MYYYFVFANKSNIQEACCLKIFIGRVLTEVNIGTQSVQELFFVIGAFVNCLQ